jgi:hypothetical protein
MDRRMLNIALCALLDELPEEGMPESYVHLVFEQAAGQEAVHLIPSFVERGFLARAPGPRLVPGPAFAGLKTRYQQAKAGAASARQGAGR